MSKKALVRVAGGRLPAPKKRTELELIQELQRSVLHLERQQNLQSRIRYAAKGLAQAELALMKVVKDDQLAGLVLDAQKNRDVRREVFYGLLANIVEPTFEE